ncbi:tRNA-dihydrouridine synthase family protein [Candidatus Parvarchaeota archaeon]|nr:tRNA-dihydrouridine synthase family protein [Candidatus Parvarchaeota archaeon]
MEFVDIFSHGRPVLALCPMVGVTNLPFRLLCKNHGADLVCNEMLSAQAIIRDNKKTMLMARVLAKEGPAGIQLMGPDEQTIAGAIKKLEQLKGSGLTFPSYYDLNLGCPSKNVTGAQSGSFILQSPAKAGRIASAAVAASSLPVTVKTRLGYSSKNILEIAAAVEKAGASAITVHARTASQGYSGKACWSDIKSVKQAVSIPVIGNGDIASPADAAAALAYSGADGAMIGRGAIKDPSIFENCRKAMAITKENSEKNRNSQIVGSVPQKTGYPSCQSGGSARQMHCFAPTQNPFSQKAALFDEYCGIWDRHFGKFIPDISYAVIFATELTSGMVGGAQARRQINKCKSLGQIRDIFSSLST